MFKLIKSLFQKSKKENIKCDEKIVTEEINKRVEEEKERIVEEERRRVLAEERERIVEEERRRILEEERERIVEEERRRVLAEERAKVLEEERIKIEKEEKKIIVQKLIKIIEERIKIEGEEERKKEEKKIIVQKLIKIIEERVKTKEEERIKAKEEEERKREEAARILEEIKQRLERRKEESRIIKERRIREEEERAKSVEQKRIREEEERIKWLEQKRIREEEIAKWLEEERLKEEEKYDLYYMLRGEMKLYYKGIYSIWRNISHGINLTMQELNKFGNNITEKNINDTFWKVYKISKNITNLQMFDDKIKDERMKIIEGHLGFIIPSHNLIGTYSIENIERCLRIKSETSNQIILEGVIGRITSKQDIYSSMRKYNLLDYTKGIKERDISHINWLTSYLYFYIEALVRTLVLFRNEERLIGCEELYKIQKNLYNEFNLDEMSNRLYPIYEQFYTEIFEEVFDKQCLTALVFMINFKKANLSTVGIIDTLKNVAIKTNDVELQERLKTISSYSDIYYLLTKCANIDSMKDLVIDNTLIVYLRLLGEIIDNINGDEIISMFFSPKRVLDDFKIYLEKKKLLQDKERYLNNDFKKEREIRNKRLSFASVDSGIKFELYLKDLFEKLGYKVTTTKTTGDQGADLILIKGNEKKVVQAKCYSTSVGNKAVQEVAAAIKFYKVEKGMVVTNSYYTNSAIELAKANGIELWDKKTLENIISKI